MDNLALSIIETQPSVLIRWRQVAIGVTLMIVLATPLVPAQIDGSSGYVDGGSGCAYRTGYRSCQPPCSSPCSPPRPSLGPWRKVGEGITGVRDVVISGVVFRESRGVDARGVLTIKGGLYPEAVFLNRNMEIRAENGAVTIQPSARAPFDLVVDKLDDNTLPLNPKWANQLLSGHLFSVGLGFVDELNRQELSAALREQFRIHVSALHPLSRVEVQEAGTRWWILDYPSTFEVRNENGRLNVYPATRRPNPKLCPPARGEDFDPGSPPCSNQHTYFDTGWFNCGPHINWFGTTYEGNVTFQGHSDGVFGDGDYKLRLTRDDEAGYITLGNRVAAFPLRIEEDSRTRNDLICEFDSGETIDDFDTPWWNGFRRAVNEGEPWASARAMIDGKFAIVSALMGIDTEHGLHVELHPVWALAVNVEPSRDNDTWAIFVRNWGNEGFCGGSQHLAHFPNNRYTFRLQWRPGATSVRVTSRSFRHVRLQSPDRAVSVTPVPGQGVFVTFPLDAPRGRGSMWEGELHLQWIGG